MNMELNSEESALVNMLLDKELGETRLEVRHAENVNYKEHLKEREKQLTSLLGRFAPVSTRK